MPNVRAPGLKVICPGRVDMTGAWDPILVTIASDQRVRGPGTLE